MDRERADSKVYLKVIYAISIVIPIVVAFLIFFPEKLSLSVSWVKVLPAVHACINSLTVVVLIGALLAIKKHNVKLHKSLMSTALILGVFFLVSYILYHSSVESVKFGDLDHDGVLSSEEREAAGSSRTIYLTILFSHIVFSIAVVPFVLLAFYYALSAQIVKHKRIVKYTYPVWMYVSITGVIVYFLISPYYVP